jgi:hypothetical protein
MKNTIYGKIITVITKRKGDDGGEYIWSQFISNVFLK